MKASKQGVLVTFEGGEGSGKSTMVKRVAAEMRERGLRVLTTREPGGVKVSEMIRGIVCNEAMDPITELMLYSGARSEFVVEVVVPGLKEYDVVLCDRFYDSTTEYQGHGRGVSLDHIRWVTRIATRGLVPFRTILFDVDPEVGLVRAKSPGVEQNKFEEEDVSFHREVNQGFLIIAHEEPERFRIVPANGTLSEVFDLTMQHINPLIADLLERK